MCHFVNLCTILTQIHEILYELRYIGISKASGLQEPLKDAKL